MTARAVTRCRVLAIESAGLLELVEREAPLANALLAVVLTVLVIEAAFRLVLVEQIARDPLKEALLLTSVCLFLVLFAWLRNALGVD